MMKQLEIIFDLNALSDAAALQVIVDVMSKQGLPNEFEFDETRVKCEEFLSQVKRSGRWAFEVSSGGLAYRFGVVSAWGHSFIQVREQKSESVKSWDEWVFPFTKIAGFVQAWVSDIDFDYWQNAQDPMLYEDAGRDFAELSVVSNGLPPPLTQNVIDISSNPGRRVIRDGYVESVGMCMWLSQSFWERVGERRLEKLASAGWTVSALSGGITLLEAADFQENAPAARQVALRAALYGS